MKIKISYFFLIFLFGFSAGLPSLYVGCEEKYATGEKAVPKILLKWEKLNKECVVDKAGECKFYCDSSQKYSIIKNYIHNIDSVASVLMNKEFILSLIHI